MITLVGVDLSGMDAKIARVLDITGKTRDEVYPQEARLLAVALAKYTQPFGFDDVARSKGEHAIKSELLGTRHGGNGYGGVFEVMPDDIMANAVRESSENVRLFVKKDGTVYGADTRTFMPNVSIRQMAQFHQSKRKSDGSVTTAGQSSRDIGRWKFVDKWVISQRDFDRYLIFVFRKVGIAKSGWAGCAKQLGGVRGSAGSGSSIPQWVTRHLKEYGFGQVRIDKKNPENILISMTNNVNYTSRVLSEAGKRAAIRERETMIGSQIDRILKARLRDIK